jgi:7-cyano-7-deazaguanine synthase
MTYQLKDIGLGITSAVSFNYGQRHKKELEFARDTCADLGIFHHVINLWDAGLTSALVGPGHASSLIASDVEVPEGHYAADNMKATVVPNRNMIMISIAGGIAVAEGAQYIATGVHAGDHDVYPDCRAEFITSAAETLSLANEGFGNLASLPILAPYVYQTKADIARNAIGLGVPLDKTWSCYKGGETHCGKCGTCVERLEAINEAAETLGLSEFVDPTVYEDSEYWKVALANAKG